MVSNSLSLRPGIIGDAMTRTGMPASDSAAIASSRRAGDEHRGSISRDSPLSSVVTEIPTCTNPRSAMPASRSRSRRIPADLVTMVVG